MDRYNWRQIFDRLPSPHMVLDREYRYVAVNPAYEAVTLRGRDELLGRVLFDVFPNTGEGGRRLRQSFDQVFATGEADTLAYIPYDIPRPEALGGGIEQRYWTAVHVPLMDETGAIHHLLQNTVDVTEFVRMREAASLPFRAFPGEVQLIERAREAEQAHQALLAQSADFRRIFQQAPGFIAVLSGPEHVFTFANDAYLRLVGRPVVGKPIREALPDIAGQGFYEVLDAVFSTGAPHGGEGVRVVLQAAPDQPARETFLDFSYEPIKDSDGRITGIFVQGMDRTEAVRAASRQRLLLDELNHRVKNTLATVQSIASQTLRSARDLVSAKRDVEGRIVALSRAHDLLSERQWTDTELAALLDQELSAHGAERAHVAGPRIVLSPKASIAFSMVVHELSTNAAKYGALSVPGGTVAVDWRVEPGAGGDGLRFDWVETGGPPVAVPAARGFGSRMIERVVIGELDGTLDVDYAPGGLRCRLTVPATAYARMHNDFLEQTL